MKKILLATAAVALTAGAAAADGVSFSGYGRFGVVYNNKPGDGNKKANITSRFRLNIAATKTTDSGVEFGAKFRIQGDQGTIVGSSRSQAMTNNAATFWAKSGPFTLQVGNVSDAIDADNVYYNGDLGLLGWGDQEVIAGTGFWGYGSSAYSNGNQVGVLATYAANGLTVNISYVTPDQTLKSNPTQDDEKAIAIDYTMGAFAMGVGYVKNPGFATDGSASFASFQYSFGKSTIGIQAGNKTAGLGNQYTLFGNTTLVNGIGLQAYVTKDNVDADTTGYGLGMSYDLGGATLLGSVAKLRDTSTQADFGVKFSF
ncbi:porin [Acidimangrovimonas sediminis]|uniref:porin n=1 Tax=Acidimangrovimonas sediminis TaxID=2056283 RepID=UPI000C806824|nr:porin [Acidimangrovimonas sediminis]